MFAFGFQTNLASKNMRRDVCLMKLLSDHGDFFLSKQKSNKNRF